MLQAPTALPPLDPAVPGCGSALENVNADNEREGWGVSELWDPASVTPFCASQLEAQKVQTPSGGQCSGEHLPHPFLRGPTHTPSSLSQLSLPGHHREGAQSLVREGKPSYMPWAGAQTRGLVTWVGTVMQSVSLF